MYPLLLLDSGARRSPQAIDLSFGVVTITLSASRRVEASSERHPDDLEPRIRDMLRVCSLANRCVTVNEALRKLLGISFPGKRQNIGADPN